MATNIISQLLQRATYHTHPSSPDGATVRPFPNFDPDVDAAALNKAINAKGVDEDTIIDILTTRTNCQRQQIAAAYQQAVGKPLKEVIRSKLSGKVEDVALGLLRTPAQYDAYQLNCAMKGLGTDEDTLVEILVTRGNKEKNDLIKAYQEEFGSDLAKKIKGDTSGAFQKALLMLLEATKDESNEVDHDLADDDARALYEAGEKQKGTDIETFVKILSSRNNEHLRTVFERYTKYSPNDVAKALDLELKGDIENLLISLVNCIGNKPAYFADKLQQSMKGYGTKDNTLIRIIISRSEVDLKDIKVEYKAKFGKTLYNAIKEETKGDYEKILLSLCGSDE
ncbi:annexin A1a [Hypanus sabinus]|uniref:annexin A1a n=1 Tax=Hypanus sabinus TaxID=79690 RepID=UPI0028C39033|nr:annexin A1a [Hypanus sabinus]